MRAAVGVVVAIVIVGQLISDMFLTVPFLIAEPGQPEGWFLPVLWWSLGESIWTWWVFVRRVAPVAARRWQAAAFLVVAIVAAHAAGHALQDQRATWEQSLAVTGIAVIVANRLARFWMRRPAPTDTTAIRPGRT